MPKFPRHLLVVIFSMLFNCRSKKTANSLI